MKAGWNTKRVWDITDVFDGSHATPKTAVFGSVRPELVEGRKRPIPVRPESFDFAQDGPVEGREPSVRPSTSSGRTEGEESR